MFFLMSGMKGSHIVADQQARTVAYGNQSRRGSLLSCLHGITHITVLQEMWVSADMIQSI